MIAVILEAARIDGASEFRIFHQIILPTGKNSISAIAIFQFLWVWEDYLCPDSMWHLVDVDPKYGSGWTGYTWNRELFPVPEEFLGWLHAHGLKVTLNVHPANGVQPHEEQYRKMAGEALFRAWLPEGISPRKWNLTGTGIYAL